MIPGGSWLPMLEGMMARAFLALFSNHRRVSYLPLVFRASSYLKSISTNWSRCGSECPYNSIGITLVFRIEAEEWETSLIKCRRWRMAIGYEQWVSFLRRLLVYTLRSHSQLQLLVRMHLRQQTKLKRMRWNTWAFYLMALPAIQACSGCGFNKCQICTILYFFLHSYTFDIAFPSTCGP